MENSAIEWCHHTANLWHGCTKVHEGCDNCYAETLSHRWGKDLWGPNKPRLIIKSVWNDLARYQKLAEAANEMHRVFVGSMMDIFEKSIETIDSKGEPVYDDSTGMVVRLTTGKLRQELFEKIDAGQYDNLMFLLLTKRTVNIKKQVPSHWLENPPSNVMFGGSAVNQPTYEMIVNDLFALKNAKTFISMEPQLSGITLNPVKRVNWLIQGGESGGGKRPFDVKWAYDMRGQCAEQGIPYFFKQIDKVQQPPLDLMTRQFPT